MGATRRRYFSITWTFTGYPKSRLQVSVTVSSAQKKMHQKWLRKASRPIVPLFYICTCCSCAVSMPIQTGETITNCNTLPANGGWVSVIEMSLRVLCAGSGEKNKNFLNRTRFWNVWAYFCLHFSRKLFLLNLTPRAQSLHWESRLVSG